MAAGKSTVGRQLAERMQRDFVDLDEEIARRTGCKIPDIFRDQGEIRFREIEAETLASLADRQRAVIATGGGAPCHGNNLARMKRSGFVLGLRASLESVMTRVAEPSNRPLMKEAENAPERLASLYRDRESVYREADLTIQTDGRPLGDVVTDCMERVEKRLGDITVPMGVRGYPVHLASVDRVAELARELAPTTRVAIITDDNVAGAGYPQRVREAFEAAGVFAFMVSVAPGEASKRLSVVEHVADRLLAGDMDRSSLVVAVGGGVVGDLAGFVAATLFRGVRLVQVPTTVLAMVDSSIGGKTGVDLDAGKNLVGAFWQPRFVLCDVSTLATLPDDERTAGFGEVVKYGLIGDTELFERLEKDGGDVDMTWVVRRCAALKADVVAGDERESLERNDARSRAILNLGHTIGHAIESFSLAEGEPVLHGQAVALGLVAAVRVSARLGSCDASLETRLTDLLLRLGLDADLDPWLRREVLAYLSSDKKRQGKTLRFVTLEAIGRPRIESYTKDQVLEALGAGTDSNTSR